MPQFVDLGERWDVPVAASSADKTYYPSLTLKNDQIPPSIARRKVGDTVEVIIQAVVTSKEDREDENTKGKESRLSLKMKALALTKSKEPASIREAELGALARMGEG